MGFDDPIGKRFSIFGDGIIIGLVKDFNFLSLHDPILPIVLATLDSHYSNISIRINPNDIQNSINSIKTTWERIISDRPFDSSFVEDQHKKLYQAEQKAGKMFGFVTLMAIFISCLGLFGIASFTAEQKTKEIGIRKALGSKTSGIILMLSKEFSQLVLISNLIAWPIAYLVIRKYLQNFTYHTNINILLFIGTGLFTLIIALLTISSQSFKAANKNPVDTLRHE